MTGEQHVKDAEVVVRHVLKKLGQQKLIVMGWSFGTSFTPVLVQHHPELFYAWVGMGVASAPVEPGRDVLYDRLVDIARAASDTEALRELDTMWEVENPKGEKLIIELHEVFCVGHRCHECPLGGGHATRHGQPAGARDLLDAVTALLLAVGPTDVAVPTKFGMQVELGRKNFRLEQILI